MKEFNLSRFLGWAVFSVLSVFAVYVVILFTTTWPITEFSIEKAGTFGDSFGILTSLFTGLAFAALIATVLLQRDDLKLNRQELEDTRKEFQLQNQTFSRQRFEDSFYRMLGLYKENLRDLSVRRRETGLEQQRAYGVDALNYLIKKFDEACEKHVIKKFPSEENERHAYIYELYLTINALFYRQTRYVETLSSILVLIDEDCTPIEKKETYWKILASQLTVYEIKYLFYQALVYSDFSALRNMMFNSQIFQDKLIGLDIPDAHRKAFEAIWEIKLPKKRSRLAFPMSKLQVREARKLIRMKKKGMSPTVISEQSELPLS